MKLSEDVFLETLMMMIDHSERKAETVLLASSSFRPYGLSLADSDP